MSASAEVYEKVTARILAQMESGVASWVKPWKDGTPIHAPANATSARLYSGFNVLQLWAKAEELGYTSRGWVTFKQAIESGCVVRKGEKGTPIIYVERKLKREAKAARENGEEMSGESHYWLTRTFAVFNLDQLSDLEGEANVGAVDKLRARAGDVKIAPAGWSPSEELKRLIERHSVTIETGAQAAYVHGRDAVVMPNRDLFISAEAYGATILHELIHWTGHHTRLARRAEGERREFGSDAYAFEELIAELGAAFLGARLGIQAIDQSTAYLANWSQKLAKLGTHEAKARALMNAVSAATKAANYLLPNVVAESEPLAEAA
jgi:antirestriction protein ArdC